MPVVGTAGHVDHGKSTLVEAMSGRDPDRWEEEKQRGLTIDLGFAWTTLGDGVEVSFVDVPGHERYLKNMLAGIDAIDVALFVVAADEGWMPQSEEHLAVLDLLEIDRGVIALTKADLVDGDMVELASLEIEEQLAGSSLEGAAVIPVAAPAGIGLNELKATLTGLLPGEAPSGARSRLWIDRSFSISGAGTVVTGTLLDGPITVGERLEVLPGSVPVRVRGLQSHEAAQDEVGPNRRVAVNLSGVDIAGVPRGSMLARPGQWDLSDRIAVRIRKARYVDEIPDRGAYQIHIGSGAHQAQIHRIEGDVALIKISPGLPLKTGDRFILRDTGRKLVVAGGEILDPSPGSLKRAMELAQAVDPKQAPDEIATALLEIRGVDSLDRLSAHSGGGKPIGAAIGGSQAVTEAEMERLVARTTDLVAEEHRAHPLRPGLPVATLAEILGLGPDVAEAVVSRAPGLQIDGPHVASVEHKVELGSTDRLAWEKAEERLGQQLAVPRADELGLSRDQLHLLTRTGRLIQIAPDLVFLPDQIESMIGSIKELPEGFTVAQFRDATGLSRKYAVPFLEWTDQEGLTVRREDLRHLR